MAHKAGVPNIVHIHSGQFDTWLGTPNSRRSQALKAVLIANKSHTVVLSKEWKQALESCIGPVHVMNNPVDAKIQPSSVERDRLHLLLLGRNDPVKGHNFGIQVSEKVREVHPQLQVSMTGISTSPHPWLSAKGWIEESEKLHLLQTATLLLVPSAFEGQPLVVLEALTCGLQVIASDRIKSLPEGTIRAPYEDVDAWVSSICQYLESPIDFNFHTDEFRIAHVSEQWGIFYSKCVNLEAQ
jgi:glycosyltransferase involved in cell wall biosynthesis